MGYPPLELLLLRYFHIYGSPKQPVFGPLNTTSFFLNGYIKKENDWLFFLMNSQFFLKKSIPEKVKNQWLGWDKQIKIIDRSIPHPSPRSPTLQSKYRRKAFVGIRIHIRLIRWIETPIDHHPHESMNLLIHMWYCLQFCINVSCYEQ